MLFNVFSIWGHGEIILETWSRYSSVIIFSCLTTASYKNRCMSTTMNNTAREKIKAFVPLRFLHLRLCGAAVGRIYELWLLPLHAPAVRIPACSWCGWRPTGHASLTKLSLLPHRSSRMPGPQKAFMGYCGQKLECIILWSGHGGFVVRDSRRSHGSGDFSLNAHVQVVVWQ